VVARPAVDGATDTCCATPRSRVRRRVIAEEYIATGVVSETNPVGESVEPPALVEEMVGREARYGSTAQGQATG